MIFQQRDRLAGKLVFDFQRRWRSCSLLENENFPKYLGIAEIEARQPELFDLLKKNKLIFDFQKNNNDGGISLFPLIEKYCSPSVRISIAKLVIQIDGLIEHLECQIDDFRIDAFALDRRGHIWIIDFSIFKRTRSQPNYNSSYSKN